MDNTNDLVVPQNSRIEYIPEEELLDFQSRPSAPKCSPVSCPSRYSSSYLNSPSPLQWPGAGPSNTPSSHRLQKPLITPNEQSTAADLLKRRLYNEPLDSDVYRRKTTLCPYTPLASIPKGRTNLFQAMVCRKNKDQPYKQPETEIIRESPPVIADDEIQVDGGNDGAQLPYSRNPTRYSRDKSCRFNQQDVVHVITKLRKALNWETDENKIIVEYLEEQEDKKGNWNFENTPQNIKKQFEMLKDDGEFVYATLKDLNKPRACYNPYNLICISAKDIEKIKPLFTITASAVTLLKVNKDPDLTSVPQWLYERSKFYKIMEIPFFTKYKKWKAFTTWKNNIRANVTRESRNTLLNDLFCADDVLQVALLKVQCLCEEACGTIPHVKPNICLVDESSTETLSLTEFLEVCNHRMNAVKAQLKVLRDQCLDIAIHACENVLARSKGLKEWIDTKPCSEADKPTFTQIAQWRSILVRLSKFVRTIDFLVLELLRRLVITAVSLLLKRIRRSTSKQELSSQEGRLYGAVWIIQLCLEIPENIEKPPSNEDDKVDGDEMNGESNVDGDQTSVDGRTSEEHSTLLLPSTIYLKPSKKDVITTVTAIISKFEKVVKSFYSLLTDEKIRKFVQPPKFDMVYAMTHDNDENVMISNALATWPSTKLLFQSNPSYQNTICKIISFINDDIGRVQKFSKDYTQFCNMVDISRMVDVDEAMEKRLWTHSDFNAVLLRHVEQVNAMNDMNVEQRIGIFLVQSHPFRDDCLPFPNSVLKAVHHHLPVIATNANNSLLTIVKAFYTGLGKVPNTVEEFIERLDVQERVAKKLSDLEKESARVSKLYALALRFDIKIHPEEMALYQTLQPSMNNLKSTLLYCEAKKDENILKFSRMLEVLIGKLSERLVVVKNEIRSPILIESSSNPVTVLKTLDILGEELDKMSCFAKNYVSYQDRFLHALSKATRRKSIYTSLSLDEATRVDRAGALLKDVQETETDLSLRKLLWESSQEWRDALKSWNEQAFINLQVEEMQKMVGKLTQTLYLFDKGLPVNDVLTNLKQEVTSFKQGMHAVTSLRNPALRTRHWEAIQDLIGQRFVRDENFTLGALLNMNVFRFKDDIADISAHATNEYNLEQMLNKVISSWKSTDFTLSVHASRDIVIISGSDEIMAALEDSLITLANIKGSKFVEPIKDLVEDWDRKLNLFSLTLEEWLTCQRHWVYLESIFSASDIKRQLPNETRLFNQVDKSWKDIMRRTTDNPNALRISTAPGILEVLQTCNTQLEKIHRCLEDFLETKRLVFARFYFISNDELLDILSNSKDPNSIQPHLKKCFSNIRKLGIGCDISGSYEVRNMVSAENEVVELTKAIKIRGAVESWLAMLERTAGTVIKLYLKQALTKYDHDFQQWVTSYPGQVILTASQILFCRNVVQCLQSDNVMESFNDLYSKQLTTLSKLVELVVSLTLPYQRETVKALLTIKVHERDILKTLMENEIKHCDDFQWKRQLRYRWCDLEIKCDVLQHNASFLYGFEYLGCSPRLVITPLTDRCYLTLTGALYLNLGGAPFGPAGTGKTETVKDLAKAMGRQCVVFNCSEALDYKMTGKFFAGVTQSGSWFCFDEFNRIDLEVLSVIAQQLHSIKIAKDLDVTWFVFEGRNIKLVPCCGVFITTNPGYAGRVEIPDNLKNLYRPVAMMVPDYRLIAEIILYSEGFITAASLSRKVVNLYDLISKQLSHQDHYDFGLRSIKSMLLLAGQYKRTAESVTNEDEVNNHEAMLLLRAIRCTNVSKFVTEDLPLFEQIIQDLFPQLETTTVDNPLFQKAVELAFEELSYERCPSQVTKVYHLYENLFSRCGIALVGPTGGGKTTLINILKEALSFLPILYIIKEKQLLHGIKDFQAAKNVQAMTKKEITTSKYVVGKKALINEATINPKCFNLSELYGEYNPATVEWKDGLLSYIFRKFSKESNIGVNPLEQTKRASMSHRPVSSTTLISWYWLILDGPVDTMWVENLNTVLDDTRVLCLPNGERINLGLGMRLIFEVGDLCKASPATVSRCGMVYVGSNDVGWRPFVKMWLRKMKEEHRLSEDHCFHLMTLFNSTLDEGLRFQKSQHSSHYFETCDLSIVSSLCDLLSAFFCYLHKLYTPVTGQNGSDTSISLQPTLSQHSLIETPNSLSTISQLSSTLTSNATERTNWSLSDISTDFPNLLSKLYLFAYTWSVGAQFTSDVHELHATRSANLNDLDALVDGCEKPNENQNHFDLFVRSLCKLCPQLGKVIPPTDCPIFDYFLNLETERFQLWNSLLPKAEVLIQRTLTQSAALADSDLLDYIHENCQAISQLVPTIDTVRYSFLMSLLLLNGRSVLLSGGVGCGKTVLVNNILARLSQQYGATTATDTILGSVLGATSGVGHQPESSLKMAYGTRDYTTVSYSTMQCGARLRPSQVQALITEKLIKKGRDTLGAQQDLKVLVFMDDLNMPEPDQFGSQPPLELLRDYLDHGGYYDTKKLQRVDVSGVTIVAACGPPTGGRHHVDSRIIRHFSLMCLPKPSMECLHRIFHICLARHLQSHDFHQEVREMCSDLVFATLFIFYDVSSKLLPTPTKPHYTFNMKDINKVIEGLLQAHSSVATSRENTALFFAHEVTRVFHDRLVDQQDRVVFTDSLLDRLDYCLRVRNMQKTITKQPVIFGDFSELNNPKAERIYRHIKNLDSLERTLQDYYNRLCIGSDLSTKRFVFFRQAVEHLSRAARIFRRPSGHLLLIGIGGSGKSAVVQLAAHMELCTFKTLRSFAQYNVSDFHEDIKNAFYVAGIDGVKTVLFLNNKKLVKECFFEDISYILNGEDIPNLFTREDKERIYIQLKKVALNNGIPEDTNAVYEFFKRRVNDHIHLAISTSSSGVLFRQRCRIYPSLIDCCTIDWYDAWPSEALLAIGHAFLQTVELPTGDEKRDEMIEKITKFTVEAHKSSVEATQRFLVEAKRYCYATPSSYIECIEMFLKIFGERNNELVNYRGRLTAGLGKLDESQVLVGKMQQELVEIGPVLEQKTIDSEDLLKQLAQDEQSVDQVRAVVSAEEAVMLEEAKHVEEIAEDAQKDLDIALPGLLSAIKELDALDKSDIAEVRVYSKPPTMVMTVTAAVCTVLEEKTDWANTKQVLGDPGFLKRLISFDKDNISDRVLTKLKRFTTHPNFQPDFVGKTSIACRSMCKWVLALDHYAEIYRAVQPKKQRCLEASEALDIVKENLHQKQKALGKIEGQLEALRQQYRDIVSQLESLHERKRQTTLRLQRASLLGKAFSEEHYRWEQSIKELDKKSYGVIGDSSLSAAIIAYLGAFSLPFRTQLISRWYNVCQELGIPVSAQFNFPHFLTEPNEIMRWLSSCLPQDDGSIQSAVMVQNTRKWPLLIDPQQQALKWISEMERKNNLKIVKMCDHNCLSVIEEAIQLGRPVIVTEIGETLDPRLESVLTRQTSMYGDQNVMEISGQLVKYNPNFHLYLSTPLTNPHFFPEVFNQVSVIDFTVTFQGLQDQLLSKVVYEERPELENKFTMLVENLVNDRCRIRELEDKCLDLLYSTKGDILDDEELIATLEESKTTASTIQVKVEQSEITKREIRSMREHYLPVATRGAVFYFTLIDLPALNIMYQFSLQWFVDLFVSCLKTSQSYQSGEQSRSTSPLVGIYQAGTVQPLRRITKRSKKNHQKRLLRGKDEVDFETRMSELIDLITETVFRNVNYGLFVRHHILFSFLLCCNILKNNSTASNSISHLEWNVFVWGTTSVTFTEQAGQIKRKGSTSKRPLPEQPPMGWLTSTMWQDCYQLSTMLVDFAGLCMHMSRNIQYWLNFATADEPCDFLSHDNNVSEQHEMTSSKNERNEWSNGRLSAFQRLLLVKILRPECLLQSIRAFVRQHLGPYYVTPSPVELDEIFKESRAKVPLIFILSPGSDPAPQLTRFVRDIRGSTTCLDMISLGRGQEARAEEVITKSYRHRGRWVFLQNCHLASSFMPRLKEITQQIAQSNVTVEPAFRLWLSSAPTHHFPVSILHQGTKITIESSSGIKANMLQSFASIGGAVNETLFEDLSPGPYWKKLLFGLCLFNAVVQERKKFGSLGWNNPYNFSDSDLEISLSMLRMLLTDHECVPWQALMYLTAEVAYGGRVTDTWDKRCLINMVETFYTPDCINEDYCYSSSTLYRPPSLEMPFSDCCDYIENLPSADDPELFGMPKQAGRFYRENEAKEILDNLTSVYPTIQNTSGNGKTNDDIIVDVIVHIEKCLPRLIGSTQETTVYTIPQSFSPTSPSSPYYISKDTKPVMIGMKSEDESATEELALDDVRLSMMNSVLKQEIYKFNRLLSIVHCSLGSLYDSIHGQVLLSVEHEITYKSLLQNQVPVAWKRFSYASSKPLGSWVSNLVQRTKFFTRWLDLTKLPGSALLSRSAAKSTNKSSHLTMPRAFWISSFFFPQGFFTSILQCYSRLHNLSVDVLTFRFNVTDDCWSSDSPEFDEVAFRGDTSDNDVRIYGLYLDGACWDSDEGCLTDCKHNQRFSPLPEVKIVPVEQPPCDGSNMYHVKDGYYQCPYYTNPSRGDSFVMALQLPSKQPSRYWVTRGAAVISQLPE